ncbi:MAG: saccharopine dehydrogenase NADP-binding domain-containing protein [Myxococcales bacterium]|nr:saccharopine dehydrogenase NADP-binding domain-containing protein [Myxococcales bacterium]
MRDHDLTLFGATGFTGVLVARYLAQHAEGTRIALAGRDLGKLEGVKRAMVAVDPRAEAVTLVKASLGDEAGLRAMAERTRCLVTTVGPYAQLGADALKAAVKGRCDYVDITGEPNFVRDSIVAWHDEAQAEGLRIVHCGGFDSVPHDVGVYETVRALEGADDIRVEGFVRASGAPSGGTWNSAIDAFSKLRSRADVRLPLIAHPGRHVSLGPSRLKYRRDLGGWQAPLPTIDPQIVLRSASAMPVYGSRFVYAHHALVRSTAYLLGGALGLGTLVALAQLDGARNWLKSLNSSGEGPSAARRARSWFRCVFVGEGQGRRVETVVAGKDPGYDETAKMLAECALGLVHDRARLPAITGVLSPVAALGPALSDRLRAASITLTTRNLS